MIQFNVFPIDPGTILRLFFDCFKAIVLLSREDDRFEPIVFEDTDFFEAVVFDPLQET